MTSARRLWLLAISKVAVAVVASYATYQLVKFLDFHLRLGITPDIYGALIALITVVTGVVISNIIGNTIIIHLKPTLKERAFSVGNVVKILGFLFSVIIAFTIGRVGAEAAVLGGTVTGLILGLALQPVLGNLFAGLVVLTTRFVTVGDVVRIASTGLPYQWAFLPAYKYFSPDYIVPGYKGRVVEIGLFYTTLILDTGQELRIPNSILLNSGVVDYTPKWSERKIINVRVELPLSIIDFDRLEEEIKEVLSEFNVIAVDYTEQSDKDHVIIRIKIEVPEDADWRDIKSKALKSVLKYRESKILDKFYKYACLTRGVLCDAFNKQLQRSD
ncbi:mechanosensitive ion channel family protein [Pyrobaculum aerophilum]|uniref:Mechanosensitive ion channel protein MscS n=1 Tax=Pyrobaculum aerophilum TaxID=13773 RepID=A0A371QVA6_9CREN|nr:mechanosensitive ion channel family protein [Pyrobaculum aerophilum]RFA93938.1 mechanosensitive ion channel protein MscS [Pyrobaculum aerophilum]RFA98957.1 mechanosensitive ion channel protein MscS [Pyrobaculum aerophilum]